MFLQETVALNVISFWKSKNVIIENISAIFYGNWYAFVNHFTNMWYLIQLFVGNKVFYSKPGNNLNVKKLKNLYAFGVIGITGSIAINYYTKHTWSNNNSVAIKIYIVNVYNNKVNQVNALENYTQFSDFEYDNDNIWLLCINIYFYGYNIYTLKYHFNLPYWQIP